MRTRATLGVVAVVLLTAGVWLALRSAARDDALSPDARATLAAPDRRSLDSLPSGPAAAPEAGAPTAPARDAGPSAASEDAAPRDERGHVLRLRLVGLRADVPGAPRVSVIGQGAGRERAPFIWDAAGTRTGDPEVVEVDISELFTGDTLPVTAEIRVDHPGYLPATGRSPLTASRPASEGAPAIYDATLELVRASTIGGVVCGPEGAPVPDALVAAVEWRADGPSELSSSGVLSGKDGRYALRVARDCDWLVVVLAEGLLPASERVTVRLPEAVEAPPLRLVPGVEISGTLTFADGKPAEGLQVGANLRGGTRSTIELRVEGKRYESVSWQGGRFVPTEAGGEADQHGRYRVAGLFPGPCRVGVSGGQFTRDVFRGLERDVAAPATGVDFVVPAVRVDFVVRANGEPLGGAMVSVSYQEGGDGRGTQPDGRVTFFLRADAPYALRVTADGFAAYTESLTAPPIGETLRREIDLAKLATAGPVELVFRGDGASDLRIAGWAVKRAPKGSGTDGADAAVADGRCTVTGLAPGPFELLVSPGRRRDSPDEYWLDQLVTGEGVTGRPTRVEVPLIAGGRLRIAARAPDGTIIGVQVELFAGAEALRGCMYRTDTETGWTTMLNYTNPKRPSDLLPALEPGAYRVALSLDGFETVERPVIIASGELATLDVTLQKR